ncbi:type III pantothenate kinase [Colwelliaceae bacterium BS250]
MNILIDIGNSRIKYVVEKAGQLSEIKHCVGDQLIATLELLTITQPINKILLVSVHEQAITKQLERWATTQQLELILLTSAGSAFGVTNGYQNYSQMGADRWLAILGAQQLYPNQTLLIVDSGTATTIDLLSCNDEHLGGWIIPGVDMMMDSLFNNTKRVAGESGTIDELAFGFNTNDNVNLGCWSATVGAVELAKSTVESLNLTLDKIIYTGGNGSELNRLNKSSSAYCKELIFLGMQRSI